ncbi:hypothetical protein [Salininema proteolyticum]|uniref:Uncharacterized protein n=1 Tax=Salininema proteolyticum TaxID=1607685 RepID=A0ABV8TSZ3_9ACTN
MHDGSAPGREDRPSPAGPDRRPGDDFAAVAAYAADATGEPALAGVIGRPLMTAYGRCAESARATIETLRQAGEPLDGPSAEAPGARP